MALRPSFFSFSTLSVIFIHCKMQILNANLTESNKLELLHKSQKSTNFIRSLKLNYVRTEYRNDC